MRRPGTNVEYWNAKAIANRERDERKERQLRAQGWDVETIWECETKAKGEPWLHRVVEWLGPTCWPRETNGRETGNSKETSTKMPASDVTERPDLSD